MTHRSVRSSPPATIVAVGGVAIAVLFVAISLLGSDGDPSGVARFGELTPQQTNYAESQLGRHVFVRDTLGHDGKFFFIQANDPLLLAPSEHASALDRPTYRSQRMLYPTLAGTLAAFNPHVILWTLVVVNIFMFGLGTWAVAALARTAGMSSWFGLAFAVNMGLVYSLLMDGATITAMALGCVGVLALVRGHTAGAVIALSGAVLAREVMILFAVGVAIGVLAQRSTPHDPAIASLGGATKALSPLFIVAVPAAIAVMWAGYVRWRISFAQELIENEEITAVPLSGALEAISSGRARIVDLLSIALLGLLIVVVPLMALRTHNLLMWGATPFSILALFLTVNVWQHDYNITRALAPLLTAAIFGVGLMLVRATTERRSDPTSITGAASR